MTPLLTNYYALRDRIDQQAATIGHHLGEHMICQAGCDGCCRHLEVFPVEAYALQQAAQALSPSQLNHLCALEGADLQSPCPLLSDGLCALYDARPIICRTHGLPLLIQREEGESQIDFCPLNFKEIASIPGSLVLSLETVNQTLATINRLFVEQSSQHWPDRISIRDALCQHHR